MGPRATPEVRLLEIKERIGKPSGDDINEYFDRLRKETQADNSFIDYLDWIEDSDDEDPPCQLPEDWLKHLSTLQFSDPLAITNARSVLSFKEVDYLMLTLGDDGDRMYMITSNPSALRLESVTTPKKSGSTVTDQPSIHPALISLSTDKLDSQNAQHIPRLVLPIGRLLSSAPNELLNDIFEDTLQNTALNREQCGSDSYGKGILPTPIKYFRDLLHDTPALLGHVELPGPEMVKLTNHFETMLLFKMNPVHRTEDTNHALDAKTSALRQAYTQKVLSILTGEAKIPRLSHETLEKKRCELWHNIFQTSRYFSASELVAVIDAITPGHPVWLIQSSKHDEDDRRLTIGPSRLHATQILPSVNEWLHSYGKLSSEHITSAIKEMRWRDPLPLAVSTVTLAKSSEIFAEVGK